MQRPLSRGGAGRLQARTFSSSAVLWRSSTVGLANDSSGCLPMLRFGDARNAALPTLTGITEGPDATHNAQHAGLADHLPANNEDHVERLLKRPLAAERELKVMSGPLMLAAALFMRSIFRAQTQPPAWVSKALQSGEEYYRARLYNTCNFLAFAYALATLLVLFLYHMKVPVSAERVLTSARVTISLTIMFMAMSFSLGVCEDWRGAATMFLGMVVTTAVLILIALGELKQSVLKIGKLIGF